MTSQGNAEARGFARVFAAPRIAVPLILVLTGLARAIVWPAVTPDQLTPDGARFFNIARCIERGQGFSTPEAWPAWMDPERLPMPETFKEPGYPYAIAAASVPLGSPFTAAKAISLLAGLLIPLLVWGLARRLGADAFVALIAGLLTAVAPLPVALSVSVMAESLFTALLFAAFLFAVRRQTRPDGAPLEGLPAALFAGALFGAAFLVRAQALLAAPAFLLLLLRGARPGAGARRAGGAALAALLVAVPLLLRNVRLFGTPLYSDAAAFGVWPYVDQIRFSSLLERPPEPLSFALWHVHAVGAHAWESVRTFVRWTIGGDLLPGSVWLAPLAAGLVIAAARWRRWGFAWALAGIALPFLWAVYWAPRYFAMLVPVFTLFAALGVVWLDQRLTARWPRWGGALALAAVLGTGALATAQGRVRAASAYTPDDAAARAEAPFLRAALEPHEAVMCDITSYWAWYADRPAVHVVIADDERLRTVLRRLHVRFAALPEGKIEAYAARYPAGRLPAWFVPHHRDTLTGVVVYEIRIENSNGRAAAETPIHGGAPAPPEQGATP
jgi:hypothetical protein